MDWLDKAAEKIKIESEQRQQSEQKISKIRNEFPDYCMRVWNKFDNVFNQVKEKVGGDLATIQRRGNSLTIIIGEVQINAYAHPQEGNLGKITFSYSVENASSTGHQLPIEEIFLGDLDNPTWKYVTKVHNMPIRKEFGEEEVKEIFETALWKYLM